MDDKLNMQHGGISYRTPREFSVTFHRLIPSIEVSCEQDKGKDSFDIHVLDRVLGRLGKVMSHATV